MRHSAWRCQRCGARSGLWTIWQWTPPYPWARDRFPGGHHYGYTRCLDATACRARKDKQRARSRQRSKLLVLAEPRFPLAPGGQCRWCGAMLASARRRYCRLDTDGRDCLGESNRSRTWDAPTAIRRTQGPELRCADCDVVVEADDHDYVPWEADHEVALEDGGEHTLENLRPRCVACHRAKTAREASARAARRRAA